MISLAASDRPRLLAASRRGFAGDALEATVEVRQGLEARLISDLADPVVQIEQKQFGLFNPHAGDIVGEMEPGDLLELLTEVERADGGMTGNLAQGKIFLAMVMDVLPRAGHLRQLRDSFLQQDLVGQ